MGLVYFWLPTRTMCRNLMDFLNFNMQQFQNLVSFFSSLDQDWEREERERDTHTHANTHAHSRTHFLFLTLSSSRNSRFEEEIVGASQVCLYCDAIKLLSTIQISIFIPSAAQSVQHICNCGSRKSIRYMIHLCQKTIPAACE